MLKTHLIPTLLLTGFLTACTTTELRRTAPDVQIPVTPIENLKQFRQGIYVGGQPEGTNAFHYLQSLGVKTLISVDGATPDVKTAKSYGMRYVHIPIGYGELNERERLTLIRASEEIKPPYFVHCHHGIHRAPTAAGIILMADHKASKKEVKTLMHNAGTSRSYKGLWKSVDAFIPKIPSQTLPALEEVSRPGELASAMAEIDRHWDILDSARKQDWQPLTSHPDVSLPHTGLLLHEGLREARRLHGPKDEKFGELFDKSIELAGKLHQALKDKNPRSMTIRAGALKKSCTACHTQFRD